MQRRLSKSEMSYRNIADTDANFDDLWDLWAVTQSNFTLTSQTAAQQLLNSSTNGAIELDVGEYSFECAFALASMSSSSGDFGFALGGTATINPQGWEASAARPSTNLQTPVSQTFTWNTAASTTLGGNSTNTNGVASIVGTFSVTARGTVQPQVSLGVAAAAVVQKGATFWLKKISSNPAQATVAPPPPAAVANAPAWG